MMKPFTFYNIYVNYNIFKIAATNSDSTGTRFRAVKFHSWLRHQRGELLPQKFHEEQPHVYKVQNTHS